MSKLTDEELLDFTILIYMHDVIRTEISSDAKLLLTIFWKRCLRWQCEQAQNMAYSSIFSPAISRMKKFLKA